MCFELHKSLPTKSSRLMRAHCITTIQSEMLFINSVNENFISKRKISFRSQNFAFITNAFLFLQLLCERRLAFLPLSHLRACSYIWYAFNKLSRMFMMEFKSKATIAGEKQSNDSKTIPRVVPILFLRFVALFSDENKSENVLHNWIQLKIISQSENIFKIENSSLPQLFLMDSARFSHILIEM